MQTVRGEQKQPTETPSTKEAVPVTPTPIASAPKPTKPIVREPVTPKKIAPTVKQESPTPSELSRRKTATNKIPAFHELQKHVTAIHEDIKTEASKKTILPEKEMAPQEQAPRRNIGFDATIITDTKSDRFELLPSILKSIRAWFTKLATEKRRKRTPKYTIPEAERRKGVIQRATSKTGTIFTADSETLREQIRRRRQLEELEDEAETFWTPFTEIGFPLLEAPEPPVPPKIQNVAVTYKKQPILHVEPIPQPTVAEPVSITPPEPTPVLPQVPTVDETPLEQTTPIHKETGQVYTEAEQFIPPENTEPLPDTAPQQEPRPTTRTGLFSSVDTNTLTVISLIVILGLVTIAFAARIIITKLTEVPEESDSIEIPTEPILPTAKLTGVTLTVETLHTLPELIHETIASSSMGLIEYAVVSAVGDEVSASYLFELLNFHTTPHLRQSITAVRFATVNRLEPALVLQFTDTDAVRGGLLTWESNMATDILPLYSLENVPTGLSFTDEIVSGFDVRVLRHNETTLLVYGIVGRNTALITSDTTLFAQLVELGIAK